MKSLRLNGQLKNNLQSATVEQLVRELELEASTLLIEHNGIVLHRKEWATASLQHEDCLELLRISPGG